MAVLFASLPSNCLKACTSSEDCRTGEGYRCEPMTEALPSELRTIAAGLLAGRPIAKQTFCVPGGADAGSG
jgi:hypothetical protein